MTGRAGVVLTPGEHCNRPLPRYFAPFQRTLSADSASSKGRGSEGSAPIAFASTLTAASSFTRPAAEISADKAASHNGIPSLSSL